jgi:hypothetical protein
VQEYSRKGAEGVRTNYDSSKLTRQMISIYSSIIR